VLVRFATHVELPAVIAQIEILIVATPSAAESGDEDRNVPADDSYRSSPAWHLLAARDVVQALNSSPVSGLSPEEASMRLRANGPNVLPTRSARSGVLALLDQLQTLPVTLLLSSAVLSVATGALGDAIAIVTVVMLNAAIGFEAERQAESRIAALLTTARLIGRVWRDGQLVDVPAEGVVAGDLLLLTPGSQIVADARVVRAHGLRLDESTLTGESFPIQKTSARIGDRPMADRTNMVYRGTVVTGGDALAVVVGTGMQTEIGMLQRLVQEATAPETPLQKQLRELGTQQVWIASALSAAVFVTGVLRRFSILEMLKSAVSLAVAAIPEGLPVVATTALASGLNAMVRDGVLVRRLSAIETLGAVEIACLDKTGTLTLNRMSVVSVFTGMRNFDVVDGRVMNGGDPPSATDPQLRRLFDVCVLCSEVAAGGNGTPTVRSSTETALLDMAVASGADAESLADLYPLRKSRSRTDNRSYMVTWHGSPSGTFIAIKGSPLQVLRLCTHHLYDGDVRQLSAADRRSIHSENSRLAAQAIRVLGLAYLEADRETASFNGGAVWVGLVGMSDPMRPQMPEFVRELRHAGITPIMTTGDQLETARAIGKHLKLDLDHEVYSRVNPSDKLQIVQQFQRAGRVVAMTGDGINDAPALKAADVGVTLGQSGTDVAQDVADVVLATDDVTTLIAAIREGRRVGDNVTRAIHYMTATNLSEMLVMFGSIACGLGQPLSTRQLLWINLLSDVFPELAFAIEPAHGDLLGRPPRAANTPVISRADYQMLVTESGIISAAGLTAYAYGVARYGIGPRSSTIGFVTLAAAQLLHALTVRGSSADTQRRRGLVGEATGVGLGIVMASQIMPRAGQTLGVIRLGPADFVVGAGMAAVAFAANNVLKAARDQGGVASRPMRLALASVA
jgi:Ca2+-transporting ATPase